MELSSAAKVNAVLQRITGPFTVLVPSSHFLSQNQHTKQTVQMTEHLSYSQEHRGTRASKEGTHSQLSVADIQCPAWHYNSQGKEISHCATTFSSCQEQLDTQIPN